jgi:hypothetical protein
MGKQPLLTESFFPLLNQKFINDYYNVTVYNISVYNLQALRVNRKALFNRKQQDLKR